MGGSWGIETIADIGVYVHWAFWLLILYVIVVAALQGFGWPVMLGMISLVLLLFGCRTLPVMRDGQLVGLIGMDQISQFMTIRSALRQGGQGAPPVVRV